MKREERLHICLGTQCNNNCVFCMEDDRESRQRRLARIDTAQALRILAQAPSRDEVMFTAGEPTLRPDLIDLIRAARELGFLTIGLITNGRRFAYADYLHQAVEAGLNNILVSIHGPDARLHDALTRTPGAFEQVVAGLRNLAGIRREGASVRFVTTTVLNRRNLARVAEHVRFLGQFGPDQKVFNCIQPVGRGERHFSALVPRYPEVVEAFGRALKELGEESRGMFLLDVPPCLTRDLPRETVGFVELHRHFEPEERPPEGLLPEERFNGRFRLVTKESTDQFLRVYGPACPECAARSGCDGIWRRYAEEYGFGELVPIRTAGRLESA